MLFFHLGGHAMFLLALCVIGPAITALVVGAIGGASALRRQGDDDQARAGMALTAGPHPAPKQGPLSPADEQASISR